VFGRKIGLAGQRLMIDLRQAIDAVELQERVTSTVEVRTNYGSCWHPAELLALPD
jgi:hypothetical protein